MRLSIRSKPRADRSFDGRPGHEAIGHRRSCACRGVDAYTQDQEGFAVRCFEIALRVYEAYIPLHLINIIIFVII